ncbi:LPXTG cell wall anchor domain-containing protein [Staphylococcus sp. 10602379]|nr:LPXTG cell wall anchor domain-containing protein [Staphylococcus sp. 10602379]
MSHMTQSHHAVHVQMVKPVSYKSQASPKAALPETGHESTHSGLIGTLLAGLGAMCFIRRKRTSQQK